jgi:hypothetical protein
MYNVFLQQNEFRRRKNTNIFFEFAVSRCGMPVAMRKSPFQNTYTRSYWLSNNRQNSLQGGGVYHLSAYSASKNAFELVRMKKITAVVHATAMFIADHFARWSVYFLSKFVCHEAAARFSRQFNCTGDFSKHYESTCKKADHRTDTGEFFSACMHV